MAHRLEGNVVQYNRIEWNLTFGLCHETDELGVLLTGLTVTQVPSKERSLGLCHQT